MTPALTGEDCGVKWPAFDVVRANHCWLKNYENQNRQFNNRFDKENIY